MKIALSIPGPNGTSITIDSGLPGGVPTGGLDTAGGIIVVFISILLLVAVLYALWLILTGGIVMIMTRGNKESFMRSWNKVLYAIIGLILIFIILVAMNALGIFVGSPLLPFFSNPPTTAECTSEGESYDMTGFSCCGSLRKCVNTHTCETSCT